MPASTLAIMSFLGVLALVTHIRNLPATTDKAVSQSVVQQKHDAALARQAAEREAKLHTTPEPELELPENTWTPGPLGILVTPTPVAEFSETLPEINLPAELRFDLHLDRYATQDALRNCVVWATSNRFEKFTCEHKGVVVLYFEHFPWQDLLLARPGTELIPTYTNKALLQREWK